MNHGHENDQSARSRVRWPMSCTICLVNKIYHKVVLRLRSSESVLERDEGKEEKSRIFTVHQDKHALLIKLPEMIAAYFLAKGNTLATLKLSNMSVYNILCCIRRQLFYERVVQQQ